MKLVVQIPAYNEEDSIERAIEDVRSNISLAPFDTVEIVVINDGSTDKTVQAAQRADVQHIVNLKEHGGLGLVFKKGLAYSLDIGADVIVNFDADLQYRGQDIKHLVQPILDHQADMVIGNRQLARIPNYPIGKRMTQEAGNRIISGLYHVDIKDATSGFRAISRECAQMLVSRTVNTYTYTIESICLLLNNNRRIIFVPIQIRKSTRESRLIKSKIYYIHNYLCTAFRCFFKRACKPVR